MNINSYSFKTLDNNELCLVIKVSGDLLSSGTDDIRATINSCSKAELSNIYIDAKEAANVDLSGINEIIHSHYTLKQVSKNLVFVYKKGTNVEKWVETTGLNRFIKTAIAA